MKTRYPASVVLLFIFTASIYLAAACSGDGDKMWKSTSLAIAPESTPVSVIPPTAALPPAAAVLPPATAAVPPATPTGTSLPPRDASSPTKVGISVDESEAFTSLPSQSPPRGLKPSQVPMFVLLGSDDNNRAGGIEFFIRAMESRVNPAGNGNSHTFDGQASAMSFYLIGTNVYGPNINSKDWRDQYMAIYENGHEIGSHGFFGLASDGERGSVENWLNVWMQPTQDAIEQMFVEYGYTAEDARAAVRGYRAAQDIVDPAMYEAIKAMGYDYGNSSVTNHSTSQPAWWPGTLDNGWPGGAAWDDRDFGDVPGVWEVPQTYATGGSSYCDKNWFLPPANQTGADWRASMQDTFTDLYDGNRAPLSICLHSQEWGPTNILASAGASEVTEEILERQRAMEDFLDWLLAGQFPDVRIVTHSQLLQWMRNPVPLGGVPDAPPTPAGQPQPVSALATPAHVSTATATAQTSPVARRSPSTPPVLIIAMSSPVAPTPVPVVEAPTATPTPAALAPALTPTAKAPDFTAVPAQASSTSTLLTAMTEATAGAQPCGDSASGIFYGPATGSVSESGNTPSGPAPEAISEAAYEVTITFQNPEWLPWDYGIVFRDTSDGSLNVLALTNEGLWIHALRRPGEETGHEVLDGNSLLGLRTTPGSLNTLRFVVSAGVAEVYVNESYVTNITLSVKPGGKVLIQPFLGFLNDGLDGLVSYKDFTIVCHSE